MLRLLSGRRRGAKGRGQNAVVEATAEPATNDQPQANGHAEGPEPEQAAAAGLEQLPSSCPPTFRADAEAETADATAWAASPFKGAAAAPNGDAAQRQPQQDMGQQADAPAAVPAMPDARLLAWGGLGSGARVQHQGATAFPVVVYDQPSQAGRSSSLQQAHEAAAAASVAMDAASAVLGSGGAASSPASQEPAVGAAPPASRLPRPPAEPAAAAAAAADGAMQHAAALLERLEARDRGAADAGGGEEAAANGGEVAAMPRLNMSWVSSDSDAAADDQLLPGLSLRPAMTDSYLLRKVQPSQPMPARAESEFSGSPGAAAAPAPFRSQLAAALPEAAAADPDAAADAAPMEAGGLGRGAKAIVAAATAKRLAGRKRREHRRRHHRMPPVEEYSVIVAGVLEEPIGLAPLASFRRRSRSCRYSRPAVDSDALLLAERALPCQQAPTLAAADTPRPQKPQEGDDDPLSPTARTLAASAALAHPSVPERCLEREEDLEEASACAAAAITITALAIAKAKAAAEEAERTSVLDDVGALAREGADGSAVESMAVLPEPAVLAEEGRESGEEGSAAGAGVVEEEGDAELDAAMGAEMSLEEEAACGAAAVVIAALAVVKARIAAEEAEQDTPGPPLGLPPRPPEAGIRLEQVLSFPIALDVHALLTTSSSAYASPPATEAHDRAAGAPEVDGLPGRTRPDGAAAIASHAIAPAMLHEAGSEHDSASVAPLLEEEDGPFLPPPPLSHDSSSADLAVDAQAPPSPTAGKAADEDGVVQGHLLDPDAEAAAAALAAHAAPDSGAADTAEAAWDEKAAADGNGAVAATGCGRWWSRSRPGGSGGLFGCFRGRAAA